MPQSSQRTLSSPTWLVSNRRDTIGGSWFTLCFALIVWPIQPALFAQTWNVRRCLRRWRVQNTLDLWWFSDLYPNRHRCAIHSIPETHAFMSLSLRHRHCHRPRSRPVHAIYCLEQRQVAYFCIAKFPGKVENTFLMISRKGSTTSTALWWPWTSPTISPWTDTKCETKFGVSCSIAVKDDISKFQSDWNNFLSSVLSIIFISDSTYKNWIWCTVFDCREE